MSRFNKARFKTFSLYPVETRDRKSSSIKPFEKKTLLTSYCDKSPPNITRTTYQT